MWYNKGSISVNHETGKVGKPFKELFLLLRRNDDYKWMEGLSSRDIRVLFLMIGVADPNGMLDMTRRMRERLQKQVGIHQRTFYNIVNKLIEKDLVRRLDRSYYQLSPHTAYKFHSRRMSENIRKYIGVEDEEGLDEPNFTNDNFLNQRDD